MTLSSLISSDRVIPDMAATEHWPAICELIDQLVASGSFPESGREEILEALRNREDQCTTGIGNGIAIPHSFSDHIDQVTAVFGRSKDGIDFGALDHAPVHFVVLFLVPKEEYNLHLRTLAAIAKMLNNRTVREKLSEAASTAELIEVLSQRA
jgi:mannitol/fructose-specific phosphotransferase system IIA component (Ntr-type)